MAAAARAAGTAKARAASPPSRNASARGAAARGASARGGSAGGAAASGKAPARKPVSPGKAQGRGRSRARSGATRPIRAVVPVAGGVVWALVLIGAVAGSSFVTAVLLGVVAAVATASGMREGEVRPRRRSRSMSRRPSAVVLAAMAAAVADPLVALAGPYAAVAALVVFSGAVAAMVLASGYAASARPLRTTGSRLVASLAPALAATSVVVARHQGSTLALALVAATLAYDAGAFLMGNSRTPLGGPVGVVSGILSVVVVAVFVAAVVDPPFSGSRPWIVFALVALVAPLGVRVGRMVGGGRLPAVRRLDSLFVAAPVWVVATALVLHR